MAISHEDRRLELGLTALECWKPRAVEPWRALFAPDTLSGDERLEYARRVKLNPLVDVDLWGIREIVRGMFPELGWDDVKAVAALVREAQTIGMLELPTFVPARTCPTSRPTTLVRARAPRGRRVACSSSRGSPGRSTGPGDGDHAAVIRRLARGCPS